MNNKYVKIVYQTEPIGEEKIILYLTTFDTEAYERDQNLKEIPQKTEAISVVFDKEDIKHPDFIKRFEKNLECMVKNIYEEEIEEMKTLIEGNRAINSFVPLPFTIKEKVKNITNSDEVHCDIVYGNITNCDNIYCNKIKGNVVNCDKIIYMGKGDDRQ